MKSQAHGFLTNLPRSPPSRGAWIEIQLKYLDYELTDVAPLAGGVD